MESLLLYFAKANLLIALFFMAYHWLLRKETFFQSNRWFLLGGLLTALVLPLVTFQKVIWITPKAQVLQAVTSHSTWVAVPQASTPTAAPIDWVALGGILYCVIVLAFLIKIAGDVMVLRRLLRKQATVSREGFTLVDVNRDIQPFSFFRYIVFNSKMYSERELQSILLHEKIHSAQWHSLDVVTAQLFSYIFWINPFMWWYKKAMVQNLEYIADSLAISQMEDKISYQHALLKVVSHQHTLGITTNFYQSLIKKRIVMLNTHPSQKKNGLKYAVMVPVLAAFFMLFQIETKAQVKGTSLQTLVEKSNQVALTFDANEDAKHLQSKTLTNAFKERGIDLKISNVKTNKNQQITGLNITMKSDKGQVRKVKINQDQPINPVTLYAHTLSDGSLDFGVKQNSDNSWARTSSRLPIKAPKGKGNKDQEMVVITEGDGTVFLNGKRMEIQPGGRIFINGKEVFVGDEALTVFPTDYQFDWDGLAALGMESLESLERLDIDIDKICAAALREAAEEMRHQRPEFRKAFEADAEATEEAIRSAMRMAKADSKEEVAKMKAEIEQTRAQIAETKAEIAQIRAHAASSKNAKNK